MVVISIVHISSVDKKFTDLYSYLCQTNRSHSVGSILVWCAHTPTVPPYSLRTTAM